MENNVIEKKTKSTKTSRNATINVKRETKKRIIADLGRINKKDFGHNIRADEYLAFAISLISTDHIKQLQESSLSNSDRLDRDYKAYIDKFGHVSKDEYLGKRLRGDIKLEETTSVTPSSESN